VFFPASRAEFKVGKEGKQEFEEDLERYLESREDTKDTLDARVVRNPSASAHRHTISTIRPMAATAARTGIGNIKKKGESYMSFVIERKYVLVPEGTYVAVIADVEDLKVVDTSFGKRHMCRVYFQLNELMPESDQRFVVARRYTVSLHHASARMDY